MSLIRNINFLESEPALGVVNLRNIHFDTDKVRAEGLSELQVLLGVVRYYFSAPEKFRESIIMTRCGTMTSTIDGFLGSVLNGLEQVDLDKLEEEARDILKPPQRIDYLTAPKNKWLRSQQVPQTSSMQKNTVITVLFPNGEVAKGKTQWRKLMRDGWSVEVFGVVVDHGDHETWYDLVDLKIDRDSLPSTWF